ncbi:MAG: hypothetical protein FD175_1208 [Beijerinckiaceae bacterium]|nr:MAG: hypothetical protein FD175_1208 [Beijerinckiaceae bacterium]
MEILIWISIIVLIAVLLISVNAYIEKERYKFLMEKYNDDTIVNKIMKKEIWQGMTREQLIDCLGQPAELDTSVLKLKTKEIYKYHKTGKNRFSTRVVIENDIVVGWHLK